MHSIDSQIVFWNVASDYDDVAWQNLAWDTNQIFGVVPPGTQLDAINRPWLLPNIVRPLTTSAWNVQAGNPATPVTVTVATTLEIASPCEGIYTIIISARGANGANALNQPSTAGVLWRLVGTAYKPSAVLSGMTASSSVVNEFYPLQGSVFGSLDYELVGHNWATYRYMLKSFQTTITGPRWALAPLIPADTSRVRDTLSVSVAAEDGSTWGASTPWIKTDPGTDIATFTTTYNLSATNTLTPLQAQFSYTPGGTTGAGRVEVTVSSTNEANLINVDAQYSWRAVGPFVDLTVQVTDATEYPTLTSANVMLTPNGTFYEESAVYMLKTTDPLVYQMGATVSGVTAPLRFANPLTIVPVANSHISTTYLLANPGTAQSVAEGGFAVATPTVPTHMTSYWTPSIVPGAGAATRAALPVQWSGSNGLVRPYYTFVQFSGAPCAGTNNANAHIYYSATVAADLRTAMVECASHYDCAGQPGTHPSQDRAQFSANGDANRFSTCYLHYDATGYGVSKPSTRCMECAPVDATNTGNDLECNEGQFCWTDYGLCSITGTSNYVCDTEANSWIGSCRNKSTQVLGHKCRTVETARVTNVAPAGTPSLASADNTPASLGATFRSLTARNGFAPGAGFCGEVRYVNESGMTLTSAGAANPEFRTNGTARTILWTGSCVAGRCMECNPSTYPSDSVNSRGKTCVNGRWLAPITIDGTARTIVYSATGSAAGVTAAFVVILFLIALCAMQNAGNRHRELYGEKPMSLLDIVKAVTYEWMCCCKGETDRARVARYSDKPGAYGTSSPASAAGATPAAPLTGRPAPVATVNPLEGKQAQDWGTHA